MFDDVNVGIDDDYGNYIIYVLIASSLSSSSIFSLFRILYKYAIIS